MTRFPFVIAMLGLCALIFSVVELQAQDAVSLDSWRPQRAIADLPPVSVATWRAPDRTPAALPAPPAAAKPAAPIPVAASAPRWQLQQFCGKGGCYFQWVQVR